MNVKRYIRKREKKYQHGRENEATEQHGIQPTPERERKEKMIKNERKYSKTNRVAVGNLRKQNTRWIRETDLGQSVLRTHVSDWLSSPQRSEPARLQVGYQNDKE